MIVEENQKSVKNYQFVYSINQKIIYEYLLNKGLRTNELNIIDINIISYLVCLTTKGTSKSKIIDNEKYFYVADNFIRSNLIFLNVGKKQAGNYIRKIEKLGIIKREVINENERFVKVNDFILNGWNINDINKMTATQRIKKYKKHLWIHIENEFGSEKSFEKWILSFDTQSEKYENKKIIDIAIFLTAYCEKALQNERLRK
jgi:DNA-binding Lrp family transcriptional regulator